MNLSLSQNRQVIPRLKPYSLAIQSRETLPLASFGPLESSFFQSRISEWINKNDVTLAGEIVGSAVVLGQEEHPTTRSAAEFLIHHRDASSINLLTAKRILGIQVHDFPDQDFQCDDIGKYDSQIHYLRCRLRGFEKDPTRWTDLGFFYTALGRRDKAERCMITAASLAPFNRIVARSAARYFLHIDEGDRALSILRKAATDVNDPWLVAAEIAVSESLRRKPKLLDKGIRILRGRDVDPIHYSELASTIGTIDFSHGAKKDGRRRFSQALIDPTENSTAQAQWVFERLGEEIGQSIRQVDFEFESDSLKKMREEQYRGSFESCWKWFCLQPFSARPAILGSYIATICLDDNENAVRMIERARIASPDSYILKNNLAVSYALLDRVDEAVSILKQVPRDSLEPGESATLRATQGLIEFRRGFAERGRTAYTEAVQLFEKAGAFASVALARLFWLREELRSGGVLAEKELAELEGALGKIKKPELKFAFDRLRRESQLRNIITTAARTDPRP